MSSSKAQFREWERYSAAKQRSHLVLLASYLVPIAIVGFIWATDSDLDGNLMNLLQCATDIVMVLTMLVLSFDGQIPNISDGLTGVAISFISYGGAYYLSLQRLPMILEILIYIISNFAGPILITAGVFIVLFTTELDLNEITIAPITSTIRSVGDYFKSERLQLSRKKQVFENTMSTIFQPVPIKTETQRPAHRKSRGLHLSGYLTGIPIDPGTQIPITSAIPQPCRGCTYQQRSNKISIPSWRQWIVALISYEGVYYLSLQRIPMILEILIWIISNFAGPIPIAVGVFIVLFTTELDLNEITIAPITSTIRSVGDYFKSKRLQLILFHPVLIKTKTQRPAHRKSRGLHLSGYLTGIPIDPGTQIPITSTIPQPCRGYTYKQRSSKISIPSWRQWIVPWKSVSLSKHAVQFYKIIPTYQPASLCTAPQQLWKTLDFTLSLWTVATTKILNYRHSIAQFLPYRDKHHQIKKPPWSNILYAITKLKLMPKNIHPKWPPPIFSIRLTL